MSLAYRPELDGIRAIAILSVLANHLRIPGFTGGFVGVDVFFVLSGYLITTKIREEIAVGSFSIFDFYRRRIRRLAPAALCTLFCTLATAWVLSSSHTQQSLAQSTLSTLLLCCNFDYVSQFGYFMPNSRSNPLLHMWSLAVEEQFYLLFPVLMLSAQRLGISFSLIGLLFVGSFVTNTYFIEDYPSAIFYLLPGRAWELLAGSIVSYVTIRNFGSLVTYLSLGSLILAVTTFDERLSYPGFYAAAPVIGTSLCIVNASSSKSRLLSNRAMIFTGQISYSLYLVHWPIIVYMRPTSGWQSILACSVACMLAATILHYAIENPLRKGLGLLGRKIVASTIVFTAVLAILCYLTNRPVLTSTFHSVTQGRFLHSPANQSYEQSAALRMKLGRSSRWNPEKDRMTRKYFASIVERRPDTLIIGSSRSMLIGDIPGGNYLNTSVHTATVEDLLSLWHMYDTDRLRPRRVIIGCDPWYFNSEVSSQGWKLNYPDLEGFMNNRETRVLHSPINDVGTEPSDETIPHDQMTLCPDGCVLCPQTLEDVSAEEIERDVILTVDRCQQVYANTIGNYKEIDPQRVVLFKKLIQRILEKGATPVMALTPLHPACCSRIQERHPQLWQNVCKADGIFHEIAEENRLKLVGSFDSNRAGFTREDFYDWDHPRKQAVARLIKELSL